jgi:hypothetical protein
MISEQKGKVEKKRMLNKACVTKKHIATHAIDSLFQVNRRPGVAFEKQREIESYSIWFGDDEGKISTHVMPFQHPVLCR